MTKEDLETATDEKKLKIRKMVREVCKEIHRMKAFVRLRFLGDKIRYGYLRPEHDIGMRVVSWLAKRMPGRVIVLGNPEESWVAIYEKGEVYKSEEGGLKRTVQELGDKLGMEKEVDMDELWEEYYDSQYAREKKNKELFEKNMPKRDLEPAGNRVERGYKNDTIEDFVVEDG